MPCFFETRLFCWGDFLDNFISREEFSQETGHIYSRLNKHDKEISVIQTVIENFKELPSAINKLNTTMALMGQNLESLNKKVDSLVEDSNSKNRADSDKDKEQDEKIRQIDEKSKVDILVFLNENWWKIAIGAASVIVIFKEYIVV